LLTSARDAPTAPRLQSSAAAPGFTLQAGQVLRSCRIPNLVGFIPFLERWGLASRLICFKPRWKLLNRARFQPVSCHLISAGRLESAGAGKIAGQPVGSMAQHGVKSAGRSKFNGPWLDCPVRHAGGNAHHSPGRLPRRVIRSKRPLWSTTMSREPRNRDQL